MVLERVQFLVDPISKDRYRRAAQRQDRTLSEWLRRAADTAVEGDPESAQLHTREQLADFFDRWNDMEDCRVGEESGS